MLFKVYLRQSVGQVLYLPGARYNDTYVSKARD